MYSLLVFCVFFYGADLPQKESPGLTNPGFSFTIILFKTSYAKGTYSEFDSVNIQDNKEYHFEYLKKNERLN